MRTLLLFAVLATLSPRAPQEGPPLAVVGSRCTKSRVTVERVETSAASATSPAPAMTAANRNFERNRRINDPAGVRDPNADTLDGRSAAMDRNVREALSPSQKTVDGYDYRVKFRNPGAKAIDVLYWEYRFAETANSSNVVRRQFLCGVGIKPGKEKEVQTFSVAGPSNVVSAETLAREAAGGYTESVVVNRIEYADGSIWQRKDWNFAEVRESVKRATSTPWGAEMCRNL
jgi:hypothetical protein